MFVGTTMATIMLSACATAPNPLSLEARDQFFVKSTTVTWDLPEKEQKVEDKKDAKDAGERAEGRKQIVEKLNYAISEEFKNSPSGPTPINFNVAIQRYDRVGAAVGNLVGGNNIVVANVLVTDANTGGQIGVYNKIVGAHTSNFGLVGAVVQASTKPDIPGIMANSFAKKLRKTFDSEKVRVSKKEK